MGSDNITSTVVRSSEQDATLKNMITASVVIYCVIFIVGTLGNGLVIYVTGFRMKKTVNSVWFLNLALADFLFMACLIFSIISLYQEHHWPFGKEMCKIHNLVSTVNMFASVFFLTAISLDRCLCIWVVVWAHNKRTVCKAQIISAVIWVTAAIFSIPSVIFRDITEINGKKSCIYLKMTKEQQVSLYTLRFVMGFIIPFLVILISYIAIAVRARRLQRTRPQKSYRIIFSVVSAFFICWLPFHVVSFISLQHSRNPDLKNIIQIGSPLAVSLAFMNSCLNPILYVFMCHEFQKKLRKSICFVLESALAEDHLSFASSRSLSSYFSRNPRKSDASCQLEGRDAITPLSFAESKVVFINGDKETREEITI
ncbi:chemokine-like receptor 1 [Melanotaenia boesemani]|uniref:chemokine-like receptor 1 n=1 Tax=Melanotaenia boesemani TaxID=1250792 RepID=UPI001C04DEA5|nr:chemokine-like receptor 1 [Melanotaenia boesemani]